MNLLVLLEMTTSADPERVAIRVDRNELTTSQLLSAAWGAALQLKGAGSLAYVGSSATAFPTALFGAAAAGIPFVPLNYRLSDAQLGDLVSRLDAPVVIATGSIADQLGVAGTRVVDPDAFVAQALTGSHRGAVPDDSDSPAVLLYTSGTSSAPKAAILRHRHLTSYVIGTVEFASAEPDEAALVAVPPYHVAGLANLLSNLYLGRRIVYLPQFDAAAWVRLVRSENVTNAMVVPTMLSRIIDELEASEGGLPSLRALSYGGARTPAIVLQRAMAVLDRTAFTNAYGLTETSSTIAVLGPDDHRAARDGDPVAIQRLSSAGRVLPSIEVEVRADGRVVGPHEIGEIWVRGEQVSGEYVGTTTPLDPGGWFPTRDRGWVDSDGYLFIEGRSDDTIIRGGENIAPAEIEEVLLSHPEVAECAVVGVPDDEWGQVVAAAVVLHPGSGLRVDDLREFARSALRGSKTPATIRFVDTLPYTDTGKLLRRTVQADLAGP